MKTSASHPIADEDFAFVRSFVRVRAGLMLAPEKRYLVESRLAPVCRRLGLAGLSDLVRQLRAGRDRALERAVVEAMMTNETLFFRDGVAFSMVGQSVLPDLIAARAATRRLRIWCAACSSGQEPYSIAMMLDGMADKIAGWQVEILATDISEDVLERARTGRYSQFEVQRGLPIRQLLHYFRQAGENWEITPRIRDMVRFEPINLIQDFGRLGRFDLVLCRNVLIYFDNATKTQILGRLAQVLAPDGALMLGSAETTLGLTDQLVPDKRYKGLYMRANGAASAPLRATG